MEFVLNSQFVGINSLETVNNFHLCKAKQRSESWRKSLAAMFSEGFASVFYFDFETISKPIRYLYFHLFVCINLLGLLSIFCCRVSFFSLEIVYTFSIRLCSALTSIFLYLFFFVFSIQNTISLSAYSRAFFCLPISLHMLPFFLNILFHFFSFFSFLFSSSIFCLSVLT
jgi:hypothetical protein